MSSYKNVLIVLCPNPKINGRPSNDMISIARKTISLNKKNNYSKLILCGGQKYGPPSSMVLRIMILPYVKEKNILVDPKGKTLIQTIVFAWEIIKNKKPKNITILSLDYKSKRVKKLFKSMYKHLDAKLIFAKSSSDSDIFEKVYYGILEHIKLFTTLVWLKWTFSLKKNKSKKKYLSKGL